MTDVELEELKIFYVLGAFFQPELLVAYERVLAGEAPAVLSADVSISLASRMPRMQSYMVL